MTDPLLVDSTEVQEWKYSLLHSLNIDKEIPGHILTETRKMDLLQDSVVINIQVEYTEGFLGSKTKQLKVFKK